MMDEVRAQIMKNLAQTKTESEGSTPVQIQEEGSKSVQPPTVEKAELEPEAEAKAEVTGDHAKTTQAQE